MNFYILYQYLRVNIQTPHQPANEPLQNLKPSHSLPQHIKQPIPKHSKPHLKPRAQSGQSNISKLQQTIASSKHNTISDTRQYMPFSCHSPKNSSLPFPRVGQRGAYKFVAYVLGSSAFSEIKARDSTWKRYVRGPRCIEQPAANGAVRFCQIGGYKCASVLRRDISQYDGLACRE